MFFVVEVLRFFSLTSLEMSDHPAWNAPAPVNYGVFAAYGNRA